MSATPEKTLRLRLRTGDILIRKKVAEFLVGRKFFVLVFGNGSAETLDMGNVLSAELLSRGEFNPISLHKAGQHEHKKLRTSS